MIFFFKIIKCELKMDKTTNKYVREGKIRNLLKKFGLAACEHTKVSMLSGGEKRKLNLATEVSRCVGQESRWNDNIDIEQFSFIPL